VQSIAYFPSLPTFSVPGADSAGDITYYLSIDYDLLYFPGREEIKKF
jgi:hypothetical protein